MPVLIEGFSVLVRCDAISARFQGGWDAFQAQVPNPTICNDRDIARVGFMSSLDAEAYASFLEGQGLLGAVDGRCRDFSIVDQVSGPLLPTPWLEIGKVRQDDMTVCAGWLAGQVRREVEFPRGWNYQDSLSATARFVPHNLMDDLLKFLRHENGVDVYLDTRTGKELCVGRPEIPAPNRPSLPSLLKAITDEALNMERTLPGILDARDEAALGRWHQRLIGELLPTARQVAEGIGQQVVSAHVTLGLVLRVGRRPQEAEAAFRRANDLLPGEALILRELVRCLVAQNKPSEALPFAREAVKLQPGNAVARASLAISLSGCGEADEARIQLERAGELEPQNDWIRQLRVRIG